MRYYVHREEVTREHALAAWVRNDPNGDVPEDSRQYFQEAEERSTAGYVARDHIEESGVAIRHNGEAAP